MYVLGTWRSKSGGEGMVMMVGSVPPSAARAGQGMGRDAAKLSHRACMTPKLVVFEAVIYPNKARQWLC